jgi:hypothetical protein
MDVTLATFQQLTAALWRGGEYCYYWTPDGKEYVDKDGNPQREKLTAWRRTDRQPQPPAPWICEKNTYFGVLPTTAIPTTNAEGERRKPEHLRARNDIIAAVTCLYADLDGKDYVTEAEWLPFYVAPDLARLSKAEARGALQKAQTAAIDAAYKLNPSEYKRRAHDHLVNAPMRASAAWGSGGGYQAVWLLDDTIIVTDDNRKELRHYQKEWVHRLGGDGSATDLARVLRVPGSTNYKPKYAPDFPEVVFLWAELDRRYAYADFTALLPPVAQPTQAERKRIYVPAGAPAELGELGDVPKLRPHLHPAVDDYNARTDLRELLLEYGYEDAGNGRMRRPGGSSASVQLHDNNTSSHYSANDPLYSERRITPAHVPAVFEHNGDPDALIAALTGCPRPLPAMDDAQKWRLLAWVQSRAARDLLRDAYGIRRPDGYLRTLEALITLAAEHGWCFIPGMRQVAEACNASHASVSHHLTWLNGTLWQLWRTDRGTAVDLGLLHWIVERHPCTECSSIFAYANVDSSRVEGMQQPVNVSVGCAGDEGGEKEGGVNVSVGVRFQHDTLADDVFVPVAYRHAIARRTETTVLLPSLGYAGRVAAAYIIESPGITRAEIAEQSGVSSRTLEKTLQLMERLLLVDVTEDIEGAKQYTLATDVDRRVAELLPHMTSYKTGTRRAELNEGSRAKWLFKQYRGAKTEEARTAIKAKMAECDRKQATYRAALVEAGIRPAKGRPQTWQRWDHQEMHREQIMLAADLESLGGTRTEKIRMATMAGWDLSEIQRAMRPSIIAQLPHLAAVGD